MSRPPFCPTLECLEARQVPAVTYKGGALLPNVEVQALYYGQDWNTAAGNQTSGRLNGFLQNVVNSTFMDMLTTAGYRVGRGRFVQSAVDPAFLNKAQELNDVTIQQALQLEIRAGQVAPPDLNRLYVVYVEDNVVVRQGAMTTRNGFGYHSAFVGVDASGHALTLIHYAVVSTPGGPNASLPGVRVFDTMTAATSHELAEAVTDPDGVFARFAQDPVQGWVDTTLVPNRGLEIADLAQNRFVYLNGYLVQRIASQADQPMIPVGATASRAVNFVAANGNLLVYPDGGAPAPLAFGIGNVKLSDQGLDNDGHAMIDILTPNGHAVEYHDVTGRWVDLGWGVQDARAGNGVSYVLHAHGLVVTEFDDATGRSRPLTNAATAIDAGTDQFGVNALYAALNGFRALMFSDTNPFQPKALGNFGIPRITEFSAGRQGEAVVLTADGSAYLWRESVGFSNYFAGEVLDVAVGTDPNGFVQIDVTHTNGTLWEYRGSTGQNNLLFGGIPGVFEVAALAKARLGRMGLILHDHAAHVGFEMDPAGVWHLLTAQVTAVA